MSASGRGNICIYRNNIILSIKNFPIAYNKNEEFGFLKHYFIVNENLLLT